MSYKDFLDKIDSDESKFRILDLWHFPLPKQASVMSRPYVVNGNERAMDALVDRIMRSETNEYAPKRLASVTSSIIRPSATAYDTPIDDDWMNESRFSFMLAVEEIGYDVELITYVFGYTDSNEVIEEGEDDIYVTDEMEYFISSVVETHVKTRAGRFGDDRIEYIENMYNLIGGGEVERFYGQRPMDIFLGIEKDNYFQDTAERFDRRNNPNSPFDVKTRVKSKSPLSTFGGFNDSVATSRTNNSVPTYYLSETLMEGVTGETKRARYKNGRKRHTREDDGPQSDIISERVLLDNNFLSRLNAGNGYSNFKGKFSYADLFEIDKGADDALRIFKPKISRNDILAHAPDYGDDWDGQDEMTLTATSLLSTIASLVINAGFIKMRILINNTTRDGADNPIVIVAPFETFIGQGTDARVSENEKRILLKSLKDEIYHNAYMVETREGRIDIEAEVIVDLGGSTKIWLGMYGDEPEWYTLPTSTLKYMLPEMSHSEEIVSENRGRFHDMISDLTDLQSSDERDNF